MRVMFWVYLFTRVIYKFYRFSFFFFGGGGGVIYIMGLVMEQKLYFRQHFSGIIVFICCYYLI